MGQFTVYRNPNPATRARYVMIKPLDLLFTGI